MAITIIQSKELKTGAGFIPTVKLPSDSILSRLAPEDEVLLNRLLSEQVEYVDHPDFSKKSVERQLFGGTATLTSRYATRFVEHDDEVMDAVTAGERIPTLTHEKEQRLFMRYNFARMRLYQILSKYAGKQLTGTAMRQLLGWGHRALQARSVIVRLNMPLVLAMGKRTKLSNIDFNELVSEGNMALLRSVEKFDSSRGFKFSTYSCRAILKSFSRVAMRVSRYRGTFPTEFDPAMERSDFVDKQRDSMKADCVDELKEIFLQNLAGLNDVEHTVIRERFALGKISGVDDTTNPKTLEQVGHIIGVTKERVRQIQNNALKKMKLTLEERFLAA